MDALPEFLTPCAAARRVGNDVYFGIFSPYFFQSVVQLILGYAITFGGDDAEGPSRTAQKTEQFAVVFLRRNADIDECKAEGQRWALFQIGADKAFPFLRYFARDPRIAVSGEVGKNHFGLRFSCPADFKKIDGLRTAGSGTGAGDFGAHQGIDDAGFADVGAPKKSYLRQRDRRKVALICRRQKKLRQDTHELVCNPAGKVASAREEKLAEAQRMFVVVFFFFYRNQLVPEVNGDGKDNGESNADQKEKPVTRHEDEKRSHKDRHADEADRSFEETVFRIGRNGTGIHKLEFIAKPKGPPWAGLQLKICTTNFY